MMKYSLTAITVFAPHLGFALVGNNWSFSGHPSGGLRDVTFPFNMAGASHDSGYYFAEQFAFQNMKDIGYCGIQNRPNSNGESIVHAVFSSFQNGTTTSDANCHDGADNGPGVSCAVEINGDYRDTYNLAVENIPGTTTWTGTVINTATGAQTRVGSWKLPSGAGGIESSYSGFVEYYRGTQPCAKLPKTEATFYNPVSKTPGAGNGVVGEPYEYGDCVGKVDFSTTKVSDGYEIKVGF
ncbi:DUF3472 domain protein [Metarhizium robertsii]|uniref:DUF3472 domain protein n=2 Tax=Metarhizium robertsii TaxID=568076 RepID=A0A014P159_9HYPO|nr:DUF3472 domain protein [Metarhizium robertsii]